MSNSLVEAVQTTQPDAQGRTVYQSHANNVRYACSRGHYNKVRGWTVPLDEDPSDRGYIVERLGVPPNCKDFEYYISWMTTEEFDAQYHSMVASVKTGKTLHNSTVSGARKNVKDIVVFGDGDTFKLICKASSKAEGWMKSTKAMQIDGVGCLVQVTTQQGDNVSEALAFVPGVKIVTLLDNKENGRELVNMHLGE